METAIGRFSMTNLAMGNRRRAVCMPVQQEGRLSLQQRTIRGANATTVGGKMLVAGGEGSVATYSGTLAASYSSGFSAAAPDVITVQFVLRCCCHWKSSSIETALRESESPAPLRRQFSSTDTLRLGWRESANQFGNFWLYAQSFVSARQASSAAAFRPCAVVWLSSQPADGVDGRIQ